MDAACRPFVNDFDYSRDQNYGHYAIHVEGFMWIFSMQVEPSSTIVFVAITATQHIL